MTLLHSPSSSLPAKRRDVQTAEIGTNTLVLRSRTWDRLKFEVEYARQKGTTANAYLIQARESALIDPPGESFTDLFLDELQQHQYLQRLNYVILSHVNPNRIATLKRLLELAPYATVICSKPGAITLRSTLTEQAVPTMIDDQALDLGIEYAANRTLQVHIVRDEEVIDLGDGHELQFRFVPTPRHPDALCIYDPATRILFTDKLFGAHVCDESVMDEHWKQYEEDRKYYFDCIHAAQATQVEAILERLVPLPARIYAPAHGPLVRHSLSRLRLEYRQWCEQQQSQDVSVTLLYTSAYGNTATLAQAIAKGITEAGAGVESINCEFADPEDITQAIERSDGFVIGSPTLGGHAPIQIQTALGIVLSTAEKTKIAGVFGSYGWSGEAVDQLENKLQDAGYRFGFDTIRVKFKPTEETLQQCIAAGNEFVQAVKKTKKVRTPRQMAVEAQTDRTAQAVGRVTGSVCLVTAKQGNTLLGVLTSWVSQASFNPPGLTISVRKDGVGAMLASPNEPFVLNILKEGKSIPRSLLKPQVPGEDRFAGIAIQPAANGCPILVDALAYLECTVQNRMECGDHWLIYAIVNNGKVMDNTGVTAVNHRKSGNQY
ncbi:diflavin flavoprotein [Leptothermofonsia sichuanensis E412]|uniref:diflavin flavoprotein n=1 Tax=Leptothermofonsia sichuanensis TaxID=2917832 RepID=UPI001CA620A1|nr:diflavin flavoprotein [Leptothermofonsia sichuanensis]QZZ20777.1 diflavin flavoprotein [Leptothermofonsia sichuanensis E412]